MLTPSETRAPEARISRRALLLGTSAVAVAAALPAAPAAPAVAKVVKPPMPTWIVGTPGEADFEVIRAATREAAIQFRAEACDFEDDPDADPASGEGGPACECCACTDRAGYEATRVERWDGRKKSSITSGDWMEAGFETVCSRCDYETSLDACGRVVNGKPVCDECLTLADWDIVDPERAAELRAEQDEPPPPRQPRKPERGGSDPWRSR